MSLIWGNKTSHCLCHTFIQSQECSILSRILPSPGLGTIPWMISSHLLFGIKTFFTVCFHHHNCHQRKQNNLLFSVSLPSCSVSWNWKRILPTGNNVFCQGSSLWAHKTCNTWSQLPVYYVSVKNEENQNVILGEVRGLCIHSCSITFQFLGRVQQLQLMCAAHSISISCILLYFQNLIVS